MSRIVKVISVCHPHKPLNLFLHVILNLLERLLLLVIMYCYYSRWSRSEEEIFEWVEIKKISHLNILVWRITVTQEVMKP
jgi:hypothetical protein